MTDPTQDDAGPTEATSKRGNARSRRTAGRLELRLGGVPITLRECGYTSHASMARHAHDQDGLSLVLRGAVDEDVGGGSVCASALSVLVKPAGTLHEDRFGDGGACLFSLSAPAGSGLLDGPYRVLEGGPISRSALGVVTSLRTPTRSGLDDALRELFGHLRDMGSDSFPARPEWLSAVAGDARAEATDGVRSSDLAARAGVHRVHLARCFRRFYGTSPREYLRRHRVIAAARLLGAPGAALCDVAYQAGFADQAHLSRAFRGETGLTPGDFRALVG